jgi:transcriptional regulator of arginine metabolism
MLTKLERQVAIREIIGDGSVSSQDDLRRRLLKRGYDVTQATLSRDMRELGVVWLSAQEGGKYALPGTGENLPPAVPPGRLVVSFAANETMIVVLTLPGSASIVGEYLDHLKLPDILGTVAGDNTLLVIPRSMKKTQEVLKYLKIILFKGID